jgi:predicted lactoylglutathione lyase
VTEQRRSMPFRADLAPIVVAVPTEDRQRSFNFYVEALGLEPIGEIAEDGLPEPLQFVLNEGVRLMLIPTVGFGWVTGNRPTAVHGASECLLVLTVADERRVDDLVERARQAGAEVVLEPTRQPWGYSAAFADPDGHVWQVTPFVAGPLFAD